MTAQKIPIGLDECREFLSEIDLEAIYQEWQALRPPYLIQDRKPPQPVWGRRGFTANGKQAWMDVQATIDETDPNKAFCIYIHIPFCATKCGFCDCYSYRLANHRLKQVTTYLDCLENEMSQWGSIKNLTRRPVSTVHLGGGTPTFLKENEFLRLIRCCRETLAKGEQIEWALETTTSELCDDVPDMLDDQGFKRIHIGVQTLEDPVRSRILRRENASIVLDKIASGIARGWVVSVDLIHGLPGQTLAGLLQSIRALSEVGVDGISLYVLQVSQRNRAFIEQIGGFDPSQNQSYFMFQTASKFLQQLGYRKTLFNHFAREKDTNLYFNFPERNEDCLAIGTVADGVFGDYHYRHPEYAEYLRNVTDTFPGLQGGTRRTPQENKLFPVEVALLSSTLPYHLFEETLGAARCQKLFENWLSLSLVIPDDTEPCLYHLSSSGSWFVGKMIQQAHTLAVSTPTLGESSKDR